MSKPRVQRMRYDAEFKLKVVKTAIDTNNCNAGRVHGVNEKLVRDWRKSQDNLEKMPKKSKANRVNPPKWPRLESELIVWIEDLRQNGYIVTRPMIQLQALKWSKQNKEDSIDFTATRSWCTRFMLRSNLVLRQKTKIAQKLPKDLEDKIMKFQRFVIDARQRNDYPLSLIANMDETPMFFDLVGNRTVHTRGAKTVLVKTTGHEKLHFTVVLACFADGSKLPPMVIFKRKTMPKVTFPKGVIVHVQDKGWMDDKGIQKWIDIIWTRRPGGLRKPKSLLVWDMFKSHLTESTKRTLRDTNTDVAVIPGGLTSVLQPLDVSLNKPFKDNMRRKWNEWMVSGEHSFTPAGNMRAASLETVCQWTIDSWAEVKTESVVKSFKKCCISNALDGTEDDILWDDEDNIPLSALRPNNNDNDDEINNPYDDNVCAADWDLLFGDSDDEDFDGF